MKITRIDSNVVTLLFDDVKAGWEQWFLLRSDTHHDSIHCLRALEKKHLDIARERQAVILDGGDLFDAMQGRFDPRRSYKDIRPEYLKNNLYYDNIVADAFDFYAPYASLFVLLARGNHETAVIKNAQTDLTDRLAFLLNHQAGGHVIAGGYGGYIRLQFDSSKHRQKTIIRYHHGSGSDAPVTRGVIQTARQAVYMPDADIVWNGHNHNEYILHVKRERLSEKGKLYFDFCTFVRTPGYHNGYGDGSSGWEVERGMPPKPHGAVWIRFFYDGGIVRRQEFADVE